MLELFVNLLDEFEVFIGEFFECFEYTFRSFRWFDVRCSFFQLMLYPLCFAINRTRPQNHRDDNLRNEKSSKNPSIFSIYEKKLLLLIARKENEKS